MVVRICLRSWLGSLCGGGAFGMALLATGAAACFGECGCPSAYDDSDVCGRCIETQALYDVEHNGCSDSIGTPPPDYRPPPGYVVPSPADAGVETRDAAGPTHDADADADADAAADD